MLDIRRLTKTDLDIGDNSRLSALRRVSLQYRIWKNGSFLMEKYYFLIRCSKSVVVRVYLNYLFQVAGKI